MDIERNSDGTLLVPVEPERRHLTDEGGSDSIGGSAADAAQTESEPTTRLLHPGENGYDEALAEWDRQQNPDRDPLDDPEASAAALRDVLVGGVHSVEDFSAEVAAAEAGDPLPAYETTKIIGEVPKEPD